MDNNRPTAAPGTYDRALGDSGTRAGRLYRAQFIRARNERLAIAREQRLSIGEGPSEYDLDD